MTAAYTPTREWYTEARSPRQLDGFLVDGDLCDISLCTSDGSRRYCQEHATSAAVDVDGRTRILCARHTALYFPSL